MPVLLPFSPSLISHLFILRPLLQRDNAISSRTVTIRLHGRDSSTLCRLSQRVIPWNRPRLRFPVFPNRLERLLHLRFQHSKRRRAPLNPRHRRRRRRGGLQSPHRAHRFRPPQIFRLRLRLLSLLRRRHPPLLFVVRCSPRPRIRFHRPHIVLEPLLLVVVAEQDGRRWRFTRRVKFQLRLSEST